MKLRGKWVFTIFSAENDYVIAKYSNCDSSNKNDSFVAKGYNLPVEPGFVTTFEGEWENSRGLRAFAVSAFESELPNTKEDMLAYLQSLRCGIGPVSFEKLYREFGERLWQVVEFAPEKIRKVRGLKRINVEKLIAAYQETTQMRNLIRLFRDCGVPSMTKLHKIIAAYGANACDRIQDNPYLVISCGFTFVEADKLADHIHFDKNRPERITAALLRILWMKESEGHCYLPIAQLADAAIQMLNTPEMVYTETQMRAAVKYLEREEMVVNDDGSVYRKMRYTQEVGISSNIIRIQSGVCKTCPDLDSYIDEYELSAGIRLAEQQRQAIKTSFETTMHIITGGPGTGKTTILKGVLFCHDRIMKAKRTKATPLLMAPTGRAARRMAEATGHPAYTIHKALGIRSEDIMDRQNTSLDASIIVVDEASMMDAEIASLLLSSIRTGTQFIMVGDTDQLPSVGCGNVLREIIGSHCVAVTRLNVIFRQGDKSSIIENSKRIRDGIESLDWDRNFRMIEANTTRDMYDQACSLYVKCVRAYGMDNVALLCPYRTKGQINVDQFNLKLQKYFNPPDPGKPELRIGSTVFRLKDKVMMTVNTDAGVSNGDIGYITSIEKAENEDGKSETYTHIDFGADIGLIRLDRKAMTNVTLAYCCSIHKSQGAEYNTVIVAMASEHKPMLRRNLIYTAVTRAVEHVAIVGDTAALETAIATDVVDRRNTKLGTRIKRQKGVTACLRTISQNFIEKIYPMLTLHRVSRLEDQTMR